MVEENNDISFACGDALVYLAESMRKNCFTIFIWGHPFSTYVRAHVCVYVCMCVCVFVYISFHRKGISWLKQNKYNARDQASDVVLRKLLCVKYLRRPVIAGTVKASNCARVSIKLDRAARSKRQLLKLSKN